MWWHGDGMVGGGGDVERRCVDHDVGDSVMRCLLCGGIVIIRWGVAVIVWWYRDVECW